MVFILATGVLSACGSNKTPDHESSPNAETETAAPEQGPTQDEGTVTVDGAEFKLSYETHHGDMYYKTDIVELGPNTAGSWCELSYYKDGEPLVLVHLVYYEGKTAEEVMAESDNEITAKTVGETEYQYFEYDENGTPGHTYMYTYNGTTYTISFVSSADISALEQAFMNNVRFGQ